MSKENELKACPFCGGEAELINKHTCNPNPGYSGRDSRVVQCKKCYVKGPFVVYEYLREFEGKREEYEDYLIGIDHQAIQGWNTRPTPQGVNEIVEAFNADWKKEFTQDQVSEFYQLWFENWLRTHLNSRVWDEDAIYQCMIKANGTEYSFEKNFHELSAAIYSTFLPPRIEWPAEKDLSKSLRGDYHVDAEWNECLALCKAAYKAKGK